MIAKAKPIIFTALVFSLGFLTRDLLHYKGIFISAFTDNQGDEKSAIAAEAVTSLTTETPAEQNIVFGASHASASPSPVQTFSWENVDALINRAAYDDAIRMLQSVLSDKRQSAQAWLVLARVYQKKLQPIAALDAWFRSLAGPNDVQKNELIAKEIKRYLLNLLGKPEVYGDDNSWLASQFEELIKYLPNDAELHLAMALLYKKLNDSYQAQYHALMAVNDPELKDRAEILLAELNGKKISNEVNIPLVHIGNQYLVNVSVEGVSAKLLLDTGASLSGLSNIYTERYPALIKSKRPIRLNTASGVQDSFLFTVDNIAIGNLVFEKHILAQLPMGNQEFDGLLGVDILGQFDFIIDQDAALLRLKSRQK